MTPRLFRQGLIAYIALLVASVVAMVFPWDVPDELQQAYDAVPLSVLFGSEPLTWVMLIAMLATMIAGCIGMYQLRSWGRTISFWSTLVLLILVPFMGPNLSGGLGDALGEAATMLWGGLLACAYWSPVARAFETDAAADGGMAA